MIDNIIETEKILLSDIKSIYVYYKKDQDHFKNTNFKILSQFQSKLNNCL